MSTIIHITSVLASFHEVTPNFLKSWNICFLKHCKPTAFEGKLQYYSLLTETLKKCVKECFRYFWKYMMYACMYRMSSIIRIISILARFISLHEPFKQFLNICLTNNESLTVGKLVLYSIKSCSLKVYKTVCSVHAKVQYIEWCMHLCTVCLLLYMHPGY